jgi:hypothetical protein
MKRSFEWQGQWFYPLGLHAHECLDGRWVDLVEYESICPDCGAWFEAMASKGRMARRELTRRCEECRSPGVPVRPIKKTAPIAPAKREAVKTKAKLAIIRRAEARRRAQDAAARHATGDAVGQRAPVVASAGSPATVAASAGADARAVIAADRLDTYRLALGLLDGSDTYAEARIYQMDRR